MPSSLVAEPSSLVAVTSSLVAAAASGTEDALPQAAFCSVAGQEDAGTPPAAEVMIDLEVGKNQTSLFVCVGV